MLHIVLALSMGMIRYNTKRIGIDCSNDTLHEVLALSTKTIHYTAYFLCLVKLYFTRRSSIVQYNFTVY
jgi:hypothetical protein